jgi:uncharacterized protein YndB with AHSA1/START domain
MTPADPLRKESAISSKFVYVTFIRTTPAKLWQALTTPEFTRRYWFGVALESGWKQGSPWKMVFEDGRVSDDGEILEIDAPRRLVLRWHHRLYPEMTSEGWSRCAFDISEEGDLVKLSVVHEIDRDNSKMIEGVSGGWPRILSSLKSFLETGEPIAWRKAS